MRVFLAFLVVCLAGNAVAQGTVHQSRQFDSPALGQPLAYSIYLPEGYGDASAPFPVLYLLHGRGGGETDWIKAGGVGRTADRLIASGRIAPLVIVMPDGSDSWYVNSKARGGPGDFETAIGKDLEAYIETAYKIHTDREGRAIAGLSMGGCLALRLAEQRPGDVDALVLVNPAVNVERFDLKLVPVLKWLLPSMPGIGNDIKRPGQDELGYKRTPLKALASQLPSVC